jgi:Pyrimidine dimer DNA glycosylase
MRMWLVDPRLMCSQHLLGEHVELHMLVGSLNRKKTSMAFYAAGWLSCARSAGVTRNSSSRCSVAAFAIGARCRNFAIVELAKSTAAPT